MRLCVRLDRPHFLQYAASLKKHILLINETKRVIVASKSSKALRSSLTVTQLAARKAACAVVTIKVI